MKQKIIEELTDKSILILGFGKEGKSTYQFIKKNNIKCSLAIADVSEINRDEIDSNVKIYTGVNYTKAIQSYDVIIKSPGISFENIDYGKVRDRITSQTELFLKYGKDKTIGVTGTKGKSTTVSLIYKMLYDKYNTVLVGNIGTPVFEVIEDYEKTDYYVYELSSHQLENVRYSPHIAAILNMYEEHLDHYNSYEDYKEAKRNIFKYQQKSDWYVYNENMQQEINNGYTLSQKTVKITDKDCHIDSCVIDNNQIKVVTDNEHTTVNIPIDTMLIGKHNKYNMAVATVIALLLKIDKETIIKSIREFKTLPHRLEYLGEYNEIKFIDDSIATIPQATIMAAESVEDVDTLIIGGKDRGIKYDSLIDYISEGKIGNVILMYESGKRVYEGIQCKNKKIDTNVICVDNLQEATRIALEVTKKGKTCILSPAAASYGIFKNFEERGDKFKELIIKYASSKL